MNSGTHLAPREALLALPQAQNGGLVVSDGGSRIAPSAFQPREPKVRLRILRLHFPKPEQQLARHVVLLRNRQCMRQRQPVGHGIGIPGGRATQSGDGGVEIAALERLLARCVPGRGITPSQGIVGGGKTPRHDKGDDGDGDEDRQYQRSRGERNQTTPTQRHRPTGRGVDRLSRSRSRCPTTPHDADWPLALYLCVSIHPNHHTVWFDHKLSSPEVT